MQGIQIVLVCILTMVLANIMGFMIAFGLIGLLTGVGVGVVGAVALHVMGNTSSDLLMFASGVGLSCMMSTGLIDTYTPPAQLNSGIIPQVRPSLAFCASWHAFSNILPFLILSSLLFSSFPTISSAVHTLNVGISTPCEASASYISNIAHKFANAFQLPSGNLPDQVSLFVLHIEVSGVVLHNCIE